jgi:V/A-type H+-transporting ATPase subunit K
MEITIGLVFAILGAALALIFAAAGSAVGMGKTASSGSGLVAENQNYFSKVLILSSIPSSQGIYGFLMSILILQRAGFLGGGIVDISLDEGLALMISSLPVALTGLVSGVYQGMVLSNGMRILAKDETQQGKVIILATLVETWAIFGLLASILIFVSI